MVGLATINKLQTLEQGLAPDDQILLGKPPQWAVDVTRQIASTYGRPDLPTLVWRRNQYRYSSGLSVASIKLQRGVISVQAGKFEPDQRSVVLHELAHWLVGNKESHSTVFFRQVFEFYEQWGDLRYSLRRELRYKPETAREALLESAYDKAFVDEMLIDANVDVSLGEVLPVVGLGTSSIVEVKTRVPLTERERALIDADLRKRYLFVAEDLTFTVAAFDRRDTLPFMSRYRCPSPWI